jgi:hypothetical protein
MRYQSYHQSGTSQLHTTSAHHGGYHLDEDLSTCVNYKDLMNIETQLNPGQYSVNN